MIDSQELSTVLAALRYYQEHGQGEPDNRTDAIHAIAIDNEFETSLDAEEIDALIVKLNTEEQSRPSLPIIRTYGNYGTLGYGSHTLLVQINDLIIYYSYQTIIAYRDWTDGLTVHKNDWSTTTGKHLNWIHGDKRSRLNHAEFTAKLSAALLRHGLREDV